MQEKIQSIREACIKANPEIVELKFGCEIQALIGDDVQWADYEQGKVIHLYSQCNKHKLYKNCNEDCQDYTESFDALFGDPEEGEYRISFEVGEKYKIIGRPIRLADVLVAQNNLFPFSGVGISYQGKLLDTVLRWKIVKDDLSQQSEETVDFIYNLLAKEQ